MPQSIIPLLTLCWAAGCNVLGSADVDHLDMLQRGAASLESVERDPEPETPAPPAPAPAEAGEDEEEVGPAPAPAAAPAPDEQLPDGEEEADVDEEDEEEADVDEEEDVVDVDEEDLPSPAPAPISLSRNGAPAPAPACERRCQRKYDKFVKKGKEKQGLKKTCKKSFCAGCDFCADEPETPAPPAPAPAPKISFSKVQEDRYWGCDRKGMGNLHGFGHSTVQECFAATLKDPACKGLFDYNQGYNGQCKCVVVDGCTALRGIRGYIAYKVDDA